MRGWPGGALFLVAILIPPFRLAAQPVPLGDFGRRPDLLAPSRIVLPETMVAAGERLLFSTFHEFPESRCALWSFDPQRGETLRLAPALAPSLRMAGCLHAVASLDSVAILYATGTGILWRSDGTRAGTYPLLEALSDLRPLQGVVEGAGGQRVLIAYGCLFDGECLLLRTDGTREGTKPLRTAGGGALGSVDALLSWRGKVYFLASSGGDQGLWITDGSAAGTSFLGPGFHLGDEGSRLVATPSRLFYTSTDDRRREELWASDGTPAGTLRVGAFDSSSCQDHVCTYTLTELLGVGDEVVFRARSGRPRHQLWHSDGTVLGTAKIADLPDDVLPSLRAVAVTSERWMFVAESSGPSSEASFALWSAPRGGGVAAPWKGCSPTCPDLAFAFSLGPLVADRILFFGGEPVHGSELWSTDGSARGVHRVTDLCPGACDGFVGSVDPDHDLLGVHGEKAYFLARSQAEPGVASGPPALWATDGTTAGTERLAPLSTRGLTERQGRTYFVAHGGAPARLRLWSTDGSAEGTRNEAPVGPADPESEGSDPRFLPARKGVLIVTLENGKQRLRASTGTSQTTTLIPVPPPERGVGRFVANAVQVGPWTYFERLVVDAAESTDQSAELWRSDGTRAGTSRVAAFGVDREIVPDLWTSWRGRYLFLVSGSAGEAFWMSDGTRKGTREILPLPSGLHRPTFVCAFGLGFVFLARVDGGDGAVPQLFFSDGTPAGPRPLGRIVGERDAIDSGAHAAIEGRLYFAVDGLDPGFGELWQSDGSRSGTNRILSNLLQPRDLYAQRNALYFTDRLPGADGCARTLYRWTLGSGVPVALAEVVPDGAISSCDTPPALRFIAGPGDGRLFFVAPGSGVPSLWITDGTPGGTRPLKPLGDGWAPERIALLPSGRGVIFAATDEVHGREVWSSDGTEEGTHLIVDLRPGFLSAMAETGLEGFALWQGKLFFAADDGVHGLEPWVLQVAP